MKASLYNHVATSFFPDKYLAFNAFSGAYVELDEARLQELDELLDAVANGQPTEGLTEFQSAMIARGFVVDDDKDELAETRSRYRDRKSDAKGMSLTIAPTISCNFGCGYCFQSHSKKKMGREQIDDLLRFVDERLAPGTHLAITWFGGEPLNAVEVLEELAPRLHALATGKNCSFSHSIITNGFLLTPAKAQFLAGVPGFGYAQITIDGSREHHNRSRPTLAGKGTYDRILANVAECAGILPITIRVNVDRNNVDTLEGLLDALREREIHDRVHVYLGHVWDYTAEVGGCAFLSKEEFAAVETQFKMLKFQKGMPMAARLPKPKQGSQGVADHPNGFVVGPTGNLFKCWNEVHEDTEAASGTLKESKCGGSCGSSAMQEKEALWTGYDPFTHKPCETCSVAPLCMSGCAWESMKTSAEETGFCSSYRFNLADELRLFDLSQTVAEGIRRKDAELAQVART